MPNKKSKKKAKAARASARKSNKRRTKMQQKKQDEDGEKETGPQIAGTKPGAGQTEPQKKPIDVGADGSRPPEAQQSQADIEKAEKKAERDEKQAERRAER